MTDFQAIAKDLDQCDLIMAIGNRKSKAVARKHRNACFDAIHAANIADGSINMTDDELLAALGA